VVKGRASRRGRAHPNRTVRVRPGRGTGGELRRTTGRRSAEGQSGPGRRPRTECRGSGYLHLVAPAHAGLQLANPECGRSRGQSCGFWFDRGGQPESGSIPTRGWHRTALARVRRAFTPISTATRCTDIRLRQDQPDEYPPGTERTRFLGARYRAACRYLRRDELHTGVQLSLLCCPLDAPRCAAVDRQPGWGSTPPRRGLPPGPVPPKTWTGTCPGTAVDKLVRLDGVDIAAGSTGYRHPPGPGAPAPPALAMRSRLGYSTRRGTRAVGVEDNPGRAASGPDSGTGRRRRPGRDGSRGPLPWVRMLIRRRSRPQRTARALAAADGPVAGSDC